MSDLKGEDWFLQDVPSATRTTLTLALRDRIGPLNIAMETNNLHTIKEALMSGWGVGCLSVLAVKQEVSEGRLVSFPIKELKLERSFNIIYRADVYHGSVQKAFLDYVESYLAREKLL